MCRIRKKVFQPHNLWIHQVQAETGLEGFAAGGQVCRISKIPAEMEVAPRYKLIALFILLTLQKLPQVNKYVELLTSPIAHDGN